MVKHFEQEIHLKNYLFLYILFQPKRISLDGLYNFPFSTISNKFTVSLFN